MTILHIELLANRKEWVPIIAEWRWDEWGHLDPNGSLIKWTEALARCNHDNKIPMTLVAVENGEPIGSVTIEEHDMETRKDLTPWLSGVFITPENRSRGVASKLINSALEEAQKLELEVLYLYTHNAAGLYRKHGWTDMERCQYAGREVVIMVNQLGT